MPHSARAVKLAFLLTSLGAAVFVPDHASAQSGYLFDPPAVTLSVRMGTGAPAASDDLFKFFTTNLTLNKSDFRGGEFATDMFVRADSKVDIGVGFAYDRSSNRSEFRDWVDQNNNPIEQTTKLRRSSLTVGVRVFPLDRGRAVGHHAWVPNSFTPYVTGGGGLMFYDLLQRGEFVRASDNNIITGNMTSTDHAMAWYAGAGVQWWAGTHLGLTVEGRYDWAKAPLDTDFASFDKIDLRGFQITTGLAVRL